MSRLPRNKIIAESEPKPQALFLSYCRNRKQLKINFRIFVKKFRILSQRYLVGGIYSPSPKPAQCVAGMKARRTLRSSQSEGGSASENFARYPAVYRGELHLTGSEQTGAAGSYGWGAAKGEVFWTFERV